MIEEPTNSKVTWNYPKLARVVWVLFILSFLAGLVMQLGGLTLSHRDAGDSFLWWKGLSIIEAISGMTYFLLTPSTLVLISVYYFLNRKNIGNIALVSSFSSLSASITWGMHFILHRIAYDHMDVAYAIVYWSMSVILLGITFFLMGIIYLKKEPTTLTRLTGISFLVVGFIGVVVGYIGGFTLLPWFTIYDFPWVTTLAIAPCCLALVNSLKGE